ncbi:MAG: glycosyltransferase 87 family protein [Actinomycetota bacterium]|nr:glycosyltransferase 87 family protein [Actinomycetota bacterium]
MGRFPDERGDSVAWIGRDDASAVNEEQRRDALLVASIGLASGALYVVVYVAQWAIFRNGLDQEVAGTLLRGDPADGSRLLLQGGAYYGATLLLFALYGWILILCRRGRLWGGRARKLALLFPVLFNAGLLLGHPYQSIDALTYVAHGYMGNLPDVNPYATTAAAVRTTDFARQLAPSGWLPVHGFTPYGPLWTHLEIAVMRIAEDVPTTLALIKAIVVASSLGSAALIWKILGRVRPDDQLLGTLVYLWNPMIVVEFAAEGHNDALMILCLLASLTLTVSARPALSTVASVAGVLVKYLPLVFLPAQVAYLWHAKRGRAHLATGLLFGILVGVGLAVVLYWPFWVGIRTFEGVRLQGQPLVSPSPSGGLYWYLLQTLPPAEAAQFTLWALAGAFAAFVLVVSWRARDAAGLLGACASIALAYVLVVSGHYWPWYASLPLALVALVPRGIFLPTALVLTLCSRLVAPMSTLLTNGFLDAGVALQLKMSVGVTVPLAVLLLLCLRRWLRRKAPAKD